ncbi:MAG: histidine phosphatase family protein [Actinomycetota bacterium]|nr:histidine phosphatase family protein [Actinomycetota bacterium]
MNLLIVRHARPEREEKSEGEGPADPGLSTTGRLQAEAIADFLEDENIDHVVSSSMKRAQQTAQPLADRLGIEMILRDDIRESDHNSSVYIPVEEMTFDSPSIQEYINNPLAIFEGDYEGFRQRVHEAFNGIIEEFPGQKVAVFCHGMVIAVYLQILWGLENPLAIRPDYTSVTRVEASRAGLRTVRSINETGHVRHLLERPKF